MAVNRNETMEQASQALADMQYLRCERLCLEALEDAREAADWTDYARILMPLLEARRQRRMNATDGAVRLGTADVAGEPAAWIRELSESHGSGCLIVTPPNSQDDALQAADAIHDQDLHAEVLWVQAEDADAGTWTLHAVAGPEVAVTRPAPPTAWRGRWLCEADVEPAGVANGGSETPADWYLDAAEALGDAAIASVAAPLGSVERIEQLEAMLAVVTDHEKLHQRLVDAARAMRA